MWTHLNGWMAEWLNASMKKKHFLWFSNVYCSIQSTVNNLYKRKKRRLALSIKSILIQFIDLSAIENRHFITTEKCELFYLNENIQCNLYSA